MALRGKVLVVGANGMLGHALMEACARLGDVEGADLPRLDITDAETTRRFVEAARPAIVVNAAAMTDVDGCEADPGAAFAVNARGAGNVADACLAVRARLVHVSTDYVFDGLKGSPYTEDDPVNPASVYGRSKRDGEEEVRRSRADFLIVRTSWLFGAHGKNFVDTILRAAETRGELEVVGDQRGCPTYARDLAGALCRLAAAGLGGLIHAANSGVCSWFDYARAILEIAGIGGVAVRETTSDRLNRPAPRPPCSALDCGRYAAFAGAPMRHWREAVAGYLAERVRPGAGGSPPRG
jgi:dTDP-4-dehydrorhamnose reductase